MEDWILRLVAADLFLLLIILVDEMFFSGCHWFEKDSTDGPKRRSGLRLYTDHATGVQYVKGGIFGGITPRIDQSGKLESFDDHIKGGK